MKFTKNVYKVVELLGKMNSDELNTVKSLCDVAMHFDEPDRIHNAGQGYQPKKSYNLDFLSHTPPKRP